MEELATPPLERRCPACGAPVSADARFCGACGMEILPTQPAPPATETPQPRASMSEAVSAAPAVELAAAAASLTPTGPTPASMAAAPDADGRRCHWCGAINPPDTIRCVACEAVFPTPEGDAALETAAHARIQAMESDIKRRRGGWWPFRAR
ncbi:MAG TPA: zinc ribbon domain-containing protein [Ktedonobacterales bacterium]